MLELINRNNHVIQVMQHSLHVKNVGHVNLDPQGMVICVGSRIVEYLLSTVLLLCIGL